MTTREQPDVTLEQLEALGPNVLGFMDSMLQGGGGLPEDTEATEAATPLPEDIEPLDPGGSPTILKEDNADSKRE